MTRNDGATRARLGVETLSGLRVRSIVPTTQMVYGQILLVATLAASRSPGGLFVSSDSGDSFGNVSDGGLFHLPRGDVDEVVADPADGNLFYAAVHGAGTSGAGARAGVFRGSFNAGTAG